MFRLLSFEILKHPFFNQQEFNFVGNDSLYKGPYITLLIGPNGTGKSQLLETIVKIFNIIEASIKNGRIVQKFDCEFKLKYFLNDDIIEIQYTKNEFIVHLNEDEVELFEISTPSKFLASAINLNDRFPFYTNRSKVKNSKYVYLGIRTASNNAFKNNNALIDRFSNSLIDKNNLVKYKNIFGLLSLKENLTILYKAGRNLLIKSEKDLLTFQNPKLLKEKFQKIIENLETGNRFSIRKDKYLKVLNDPTNFELVSNFFRHLIPNFSEFNKNFRYSSLIKFNDRDNIELFLEEISVLKLMRDLELLNVEKLLLHRKSSKYTFDNASSGEHHILSGFINIISTIENNALILIDEPEISLHPNWQIQYMNLLQATFNDYKNCHFIISTHSHFLVSDLKPENSSIISFHLNENGEVFNQTLEFETFGWSTENILYRVFGVSSFRNYYLEMDLRELLSKISENSTEFVRMREIIKSLKRFDLTPDDPLSTIINTAEEYLKENGN